MKLKRETQGERICDLHKQHVFIRERRPERDLGHQSNTLRGVRAHTGWGF
jgi:hypothetical protein